MLQVFFSRTLLSALLLRPGDISVPLRGAALPRGAGGAAAFSESGVSRRGAALTLGAGAAAVLLPPLHAFARAPGSEDVGEAIEQVKDAAAVLRDLRKHWEQYAVIDAEGRAGNIDAARRVLGGVTPQRGAALAAAAEATPLYRIDGAFAALRKAALNAADGTWGSRLDIEEFVEKGEDIVFALKKADDSFYGVVFASKGSTQLAGLYLEARDSVDRALTDFDSILSYLKEAGAPGV